MPTMCILCGFHTQQQQNICADCEINLPILQQNCQQCAKHLPSQQITLPLCGDCLQHPPPFDRTYALFPYKAPIMQLIIRLKFQHQLSHALTFGTLLTNKIRDDWYRNRSLPDLILPMPLHPLRLKERGFNQALEIAKPVASVLRIPLDLHGLKRIKMTLAQSTLSALDRKSNITNAFLTTHCYENKWIALVDDVMSTGHTLAECTRVLKKAGARQVDVWCCARNDNTANMVAENAKTR